MGKRIKRQAVRFAVILIIAAVAGTGLPVEAASKKPIKLSVSVTTKTIDIKGKALVSVKAVKPKGASKSVTYKSSNKKIATVSSKGVVIGKKKGTVKITVVSKKNKKLKRTVTIKVKNLKPKSIKMRSTLTLCAGGKQKLEATVKPVGVYCPVSWKSNNSAVASVNKSGEVTAKTPGTAVITVKTKQKNSKNKYLTKSCKITVIAKAGAPIVQDKETVIFPNEKITKDIDGNRLTCADATVAENKLQTPEGKEVKATYVSDNEGVVEVDGNGMAVTKGYGKAVITATTADGRNASYEVEVVDRSKDDIEWKYMEPEETFKRVDEGTIAVLDIRSQLYYEAGHIKGSYQAPSWPVKKKSAEDVLRENASFLKEIETDIVIVCMAGEEGSMRAISVLAEEGVAAKKLYILTGGGYNLWDNFSDRLVQGPEES